MSLPPTYDCPAALSRISKGLVKLGCPQERAEWAAQVALDEAPFDRPTEDGWTVACQRARYLANMGPQVNVYEPTPDGIRPG